MSEAIDLSDLLADPRLESLILDPTFINKYRNVMGKRLLNEQTYAGPMDIEIEVTPDQKAALFDRLKGVWAKFGETDPHYSVVSAEQFRAKNIGDNIEAFFATGQYEVNGLDAILGRAGITGRKFSSALEYGCGVGRVSRTLSKRVDTYYGVDVSRPHLDLMERQLAEAGITNVKAIQVKDMNDLATLPEVDLIYSKIVLQHNPPPIQAQIILSLLRALNPGGVAVFQTLTHWKTYKFSAAAYLAEAVQPNRLETHIIPQHVIFDLARRTGCSVRDVTRDHLAPLASIVSTNFVIESKRL